jgi:hypothetical protein
MKEWMTVREAADWWRSPVDTVRRRLQRRPPAPTLARKSGGTWLVSAAWMCPCWGKAPPDASWAPVPPVWGPRRAGRDHLPRLRAALAGSPPAPAPLPPPVGGVSGGGGPRPCGGAPRRRRPPPSAGPGGPRPTRAGGGGRLATRVARHARPRRGDPVPGLAGRPAGPGRDPRRTGYGQPAEPGGEHQLGPAGGAPDHGHHAAPGRRAGGAGARPGLRWGHGDPGRAVCPR